MQVPKNTDPMPADCLNSPVGGEALVAGKLRDITWTAYDDVNVDHFDLYYSTDGSTMKPIVSNVPGSRVEYQWNVPLLESETAWVKLVAHDDDTNTSESINAAPFAIESALQHVYDFSTGAGVDKFAGGHQTTGWTAMNNVRKPASLVQLSAANYVKIAASDASGTDSDPNRYKSPNPSTNFRSTHVFEFTIDEDPSQILDLEVLWEGVRERLRSDGALHLGLRGRTVDRRAGWIRAEPVLRQLRGKPGRRSECPHP